MQRFALLNAPIVTGGDGLYEYITISRGKAVELVDKYGIESFIGHETTAQVLSVLLGIKVEFRRGEFKQTVSQDAIIFKLNRRAPEGTVLTIEEIEQIGFSFVILRKLTDARTNSAEYFS